jgi:protein sex-lethal
MDYGNQSSSYPYPSSNTSTSSSQGQQDDDGSNRKNLIINYLPQHLSDRDLYDLFIPYGNIENARVMKDKKTNYSYGYGFVNYTEESSATEAINAMNGKRVDHKFLKVSLARPSGEEIKDTNLYVCNLRRDITEDDLIRMFSPFGEIVQQNILQDKYTGLPRGVAFVRFSKRAEANAAIDAMNNFIPEGSTEALRVKLAENHGKQKSAYLSGFQDGFSQYGPRRF